MIVKEKEIKNKLKAKGVLVNIDKNGFRIKDEKTEIVELLSFDDLKIFINKSISFSMADSIKEDIEGDA